MAQQDEGVQAQVTEVPARSPDMGHMDKADPSLHGFHLSAPPQAPSPFSTPPPARLLKPIRECSLERSQLPACVGECGGMGKPRPPPVLPGSCRTGGVCTRRSTPAHPRAPYNSPVSSATCTVVRTPHYVSGPNLTSSIIISR